ncbi:FAD:protein FMN transferase [Gilliamella apis]|uniref:FAD:protein FMN transferase n=1 Tax=Gilliamella apis TaxID=1970738 RepID=UPI000A330786|nr:FAD:protein FMN transferase [Gilliamella apis]OTQ60910.1 thiamine biosynthesis protein ApbE [Gilliamella apis]OTQ65564.1 thiamine biosynthesis protein ApbE [Gilliamella apis]OTQ66777.1 thiamine biosynthesis protein ApbE [Gilliamella apis]OTQ67513.1 thiamine biosynthesis protein ApbE [Gilliamella apis]
MHHSRYEYTQAMMGTTVSLMLFEPNETVVQHVFNTINQLENKLTVNRPVSEVMSINNAAGKHPVRVSHAVYSLIEQAWKVSLMPDSCFNVAIGPLVKLWKIGFSGHQVPNPEQIVEKRSLIDPNDIKLDPKSCSVFLKKAGMEIDLGAIAKGYIADVIKLVLQQHNVYQAIVNLGGNVLTTGDSPIDAEGYWHIGLKKPFSSIENELVGLIKVKNKSVVTSGTYERYFIENQHVYHHILDSKTGYPLDNELESITIISDTSLEGDIYSTILYGFGTEKTKQLLKSQQNLSAIFLLKDKTIKIVNPDNFAFQLLDQEYQIS